MYRALSTLLAVFLFSTTCQIGLAQQWEFTMVGVGSKPAIDVDTNGIPHIAYMLEASPGFVNHAVQVNDTFESTTVQMAYYYGPLDIAIGPHNRPGISVHHHDEQDEIVFLLNSDGNWSAEIVEHGGHDGWDNSITFDSQGFPHTSSVDPSQFGSAQGIEYAWKDAGGWHKENIGAGPVAYQFATSIALNMNDAPHIAYFADDALYYASKATGAWQIEEVDMDGGMFPSLVIDPDGNPHIAYYVRANGDEGVVRYANKTGSIWQFQDVDALFNVPISFTGARRVTSLQMDQNCGLHVSYGDRDIVKYAVLDSGVWIIDTVVDVSQDTIILGAQTDLSLAKNGTPHITYFEVTSLGPLNGIVKHAKRIFPDLDMDGFGSNIDCNDDDPEINPDALEIPNNDIDENCDGIILIIDNDNDGFNSDDDCDDDNPDINPDAIEIPNNDVDENCDGVILVIDNDNDGFNSDDDCNDDDPDINPDALEIPNNDIDENCDGIILIIDNDNDGFNSDDDCNDDDPDINPDAIEIPNNDVDENCDGIILIIDNDNDGFNSDDDCNDDDPDINPDAIEIPNNDVDENCDGIILVIDNDNDGFNSDEDCNDDDPDINPDAIEIPNNDVDENCDGVILVIDNDNDGFNSDDDCNDDDPDINPDAVEIPGNGIDEDCDGIDGTSGTHELDGGILIIYPNPVHETLRIEFPGKGGYQLSLMSLTGQMLWQKEVSGSEINIDVGDLPDGVYLFRIVSQATQSAVVERILKG